MNTNGMEEDEIIDIRDIKNKWNYIEDEIERNKKVKFPDRGDKLPKLRLYNKININELGPGCYQVNFNALERHTPAFKFPSSVRDRQANAMNGRQITNEINYLPIFSRKVEVEKQEGYEKSFNKLMKEIKWKVNEDHNKNKKNLLHPFKDLTFRPLDAEFADKFDKEYREKMKNARRIANKIKFRIKDTK